ncbi:GGDEF domain-containing protein [Salisediminibacterium selenitireducens]|uniref:Diguanylate cyclase n=1 Tax=Bacillus selenitireducens (strain ATCC 700615 / DSM 15326 / MLS10) TaxID=439292 RepID=D6XZT1_BACIE|nr:GGDEF domain-containing protein [Salisediminibacterium selenitireducens]ADI00433.1 diguanylate cyclase [[Bacillus] selenitireducens MLS10]
MRTIQIRLLYTMLTAAMAVSLVNIVGNAVIGFDWPLSIKWFLLLMACLITLFQLRRHGYRERPIYVFFLFIILVFLPYGYIESGGASNNTIGYLFLVLLSFSYLFRGWKRGILAALMIAMFTGLHVLEYIQPGLFLEHDPATQFLDRLIQIPLLLIASMLIIRKFAIDYERVHDDLDRVAKRDPLTGLYNRRAFNEEIEQIINHKRTSYCLALMDLDRFKRLNDRHGHQTGDEFLKLFSELLRTHFPEDNQIISRWGGDEFAILYTGGPDELEERLSAVKTAFTEEVEKVEPGVGVSYGVVPVDGGEHPEALLIKADTRLYEAKENRPEAFAEAPKKQESS